MASGVVGGQQSAEVDPVSKFKILIPHLKESLGNLMKVAAQVFQQNAQLDSCERNPEVTGERFEKSLEEFYAVCNQIEFNLRLASECNSHNLDSTKNVQGLQLPAKADGQQTQPDAQSHPQYLNLIRTQIACAKEVHEALAECAKKM